MDADRRTNNVYQQVAGVPRHYRHECS